MDRHTLKRLAGMPSAATRPEISEMAQELYDAQDRIAYLSNLVRLMEPLLELVSHDPDMEDDPEWRRHVRSLRRQAERVRVPIGPLVTK